MQSFSTEYILQLGVWSSSKIESELGLRQNQMVIKMDVLTTSDCCSEPYLGLSDIRSAATNQIYLLLRADLNCNGLLCVRIKTAGLSQQCGKAINSKWGTDKEIHQTMMPKKSINKKQEQTKKSTKMMASISCNFSLSALPNINHTAVWLTGVGARNAIPSKKSKLPAQYWINLNVYSAWTTIKYWCFLCKHFKIWNWRIPSWLDKHHHHSVAAGEACENCLLVTWASALPAISCQSLIYVAPWCFKWMGWDWVGWVGSPGGVNC